MADKDGSNFVAGIVLGSAIGFILGIMFAPAPGEETQKLVYSKGAEYGKEVGRIASHVASKVKDEIDKRIPKKDIPSDPDEIH
jgi:gas vesicle protein